jgi:hypothetical protein
MCKFLSAIVLKNGDVLANPLIDSHESLMLLFGVKEWKLLRWLRASGQMAAAF